MQFLIGIIVAVLLISYSAEIKTLMVDSGARDRAIAYLTSL